MFEGFELDDIFEEVEYSSLEKIVKNAIMDILMVQSQIYKKSWDIIILPTCHMVDGNIVIMPFEIFEDDTIVGRGNVYVNVDAVDREEGMIEIHRIYGTVEWLI